MFVPNLTELKRSFQQRFPSLFVSIKSSVHANSGVSRRIRLLNRRLLFKRAEQAHVRLLSGRHEKEYIRVLFIALHRSVWKTDEVFQAMQASADFEPSILLVPTIGRDSTWAEAEQRDAQCFFEGLGYRTHYAPAADGPDAAIRQVEDIAPDVIFFTNHHTLTFPQLYDHLLENYLTCYVPYSASVSRFDDHQAQYNKNFHNQVWKIFAPHGNAVENFRSTQAIAGRNVSLTGYPGFEPLVKQGSATSDPWRPLGLKKVIWAPHHTIDMPNLPYANFLRYAEIFRGLVEEYSEHVQWCFKPHPLLKPKLITNPEWGPERTEEYYEFWSSHTNTQMELGDYTDLFRFSDAMIHDSGSFLAEYLYVDQPVLYLWSSPEVINYFNEFGLEALAASDRADDEADIRGFLDRLLEGNDPGQSQRQSFLDRHPVSIDGALPSERILMELKRSIFSTDTSRT